MTDITTTSDATTTLSNVLGIRQNNITNSIQTPLHNNYTFWYHRRGSNNNKGTAASEYEPNQIGTFSTVEGFWDIYNHLQRPNSFKVTTDYHLFREGIKPTWEDEMNMQGGKWMVRLKKGIASHYWEELILAIIGEQFDVGGQICGAVVSVRHNEDIISVWNKNADLKDATNKIRTQIRSIFKLPSFISIEYKKHIDAKADGSSFRNPSMVWKANSRAEAFRDSDDKDNRNKGRDRNSNRDRDRDRSSHNSHNNSWKPVNKSTEGGKGGRSGSGENTWQPSRK